MIDIHSHVIPFIDDGSKSLDTSLKLIEEEKRQGVTDIICTPHFRASAYEPSAVEIEKGLEELRKASEHLGVNLYSGQEIATRKSVAKDVAEKVRLPLAGSNYVLLEFDYNNYVDIAEIAYEMKVAGYYPIIAHVERYSYVTLSDVEDIIESGGYIQVNAPSLFRQGSGKFYRKTVIKLLKNDLVHFIASDVHSGRENKMAEAFEFVKKKFGAERADTIFNLNPRAIIENKRI